jgi:hypothetical protein
MNETPRRDFLRSAGSFALLPALQSDVELVLFNANVVTMDDQKPRARALAVAGGRFLAVGGDADVKNLATARTLKLDLGGRTVVPGFIDAHSHPASSGYKHLKQVDAT